MEYANDLKLAQRLAREIDWSFMPSPSDIAANRDYDILKPAQLAMKRRKLVGGESSRSREKEDENSLRHWREEIAEESRWIQTNDRDWYDYTRILGEMICTPSPFKNQNGVKAQQWRFDWFEEFIKRQEETIHFHKLVEVCIESRKDARGPAPSPHHQALLDEITDLRRRQRELQCQSISDINKGYLSFIDVWNRMFLPRPNLFMSEFEVLQTQLAASCREVTPTKLPCGTIRPSCAYCDDLCHQFFDDETGIKQRLFPPTTAYDVDSQCVFGCDLFGALHSPEFPRGLLCPFFDMSHNPLKDSLHDIPYAVINSSCMRPQSGRTRPIKEVFNPCMQPPVTPWPGHFTCRWSPMTFHGFGTDPRNFDASGFYPGSLVELKSLSEMHPHVQHLQSKNADGKFMRIGVSTIPDSNFGCFAICTLQPWQWLEPYVGEWDDCEERAFIFGESDAVEPCPCDGTVNQPEKGFVKGDKQRCYGPYINEAFDNTRANTQVLPRASRNNQLWVQVCKNEILPGKELLRSYGVEYWVLRFCYGKAGSVSWDAICRGYDNAEAVRGRYMDEVQKCLRHPFPTSAVLTAPTAAESNVVALPHNVPSDPEHPQRAWRSRQQGHHLSFGGYIGGNSTNYSKRWH